jgi:hypothetical protein
MDSYEGDPQSPVSLHKYLYNSANPVNKADPSGHDDFDMASLGVSESMSETLDTMPSSGTHLISGAPVYPVVLVNQSMSVYTPWTQVKNQAQANVAGLPIGMPIRIAVPSSIDPQALVNQWRSDTPPSALTWVEFGVFWVPSGPNDYKRKYGPIYDAFGNFEYGATGAAAGFGLDTLLWAASAIKSTPQSPINETDITSGFDAVRGGGTLNAIPRRLFP